MGKYRRNKEMMQRMYGVQALQEAFNGIMFPIIQIHNYIDSLINNPAGTLTIQIIKHLRNGARTIALVDFIGKK